MILLTAVGKDRPGIAARVARVLFETGCNIEDSSMTILCGEFAILLMLSAPDGLTVAKLDAAFGPVRQELELHVALRLLADELVAAPIGEDGSAYIVSVAGADRPGIVWRVTDLLASEGINIADLESKSIRSGPARVYMLVLEIVLPPGSELASVEARLAHLAAEIGVEIHVNPVASASL